MSKQAIEQVVRKASSNARFRAQLASDFEVAVKPFKLTAAEKTQLRKGAGVRAAAKVPERQAARETTRVSARTEARQLARQANRQLSRQLARAEPRQIVRAEPRQIVRAEPRQIARVTGEA